MEKSAHKNIAFIIGVAALALALAGGGYAWYRINLLSRRLDDASRTLATETAKVQDLEAAVNGTNDTVATALTQASQKSADLSNQFSEISNTVGALEKLSTIDPELLKKYSKVYFLNEHYVPLALTDIDADYRSKSATNYQFLSDALPHLEALFEAADGDAGLGLKAQSAYRSFGTQSALKAAYKVTYGAGTANSFSADQGYSEHQLGTALDFTTDKLSGGLEGFDKTPEYQWLLANAYKYGFIISYPANNAYYKFEPWHWRFVGVALATRLHDDNMYFYGLDQRIIDTYLANIFD